MKKILFSVLFFVSFFLLGQDFYVLSKNGLNLRKAPSDKSEILGVVPYNTKLNILEKNVSEKFKVNGFSGTYVKIKYKGIVGYIFSGFLSRLEAVKEEESLEEYFIRVFGKPVITKSDDELFSDDIWTYPNGFVYKSIGEASKYSGYEDRYYFKDLTIQEVFLFARDISGFLNSIRDTSELKFECENGCDFETEEGLYNGYSLKKESGVIILTDFGEI